MASDAQILSDGAVEQASTVQELSASIQTLAGQVGSTSADADDARRCSADMENQLNLCSEKMDQLTKAMSDISASSQQISGIIKTIEDISFQTNILALNAAVEAARAVPLERIMIETDSPYMAPAPHRGKRNDSGYVRHVCEKLAEIKGISFEECARITL